MFQVEPHPDEAGDDHFKMRCPTDLLDNYASSIDTETLKFRECEMRKLELACPKRKPAVAELPRHCPPSNPNSIPAACGRNLSLD